VCFIVDVSNDPFNCVVLRPETITSHCGPGRPHAIYTTPMLWVAL